MQRIFKGLLIRQVTRRTDTVHAEVWIQIDVMPLVYNVTEPENSSC